MKLRTRCLPLRSGICLGFAARCTRSPCRCIRSGFQSHGDHSELSGDALENKVIAEVIDRINQDHVAPADLLAKVKADASGIRAFIVQKDLLTLSDRDNMRIVPTPEFERGVLFGRRLSSRAGT